MKTILIKIAKMNSKLNKALKNKTNRQKKGLRGLSKKIKAHVGSASVRLVCLVSLANVNMYSVESTDMLRIINVTSISCINIKRKYGEKILKSRKIN